MVALAAREIYLAKPLFQDYTSFVNATMFRASKIFDIYPSLDYRTLDATLLFASVSGNEATIFMYGDGVVFQLRHDCLQRYRIWP